MASINNEKLVICIGDIHGCITKLENLWSNLQTQINPFDFEQARIIFLGDYCDHGPNTREVLDFLISLPSKHPKQSHVFLAGNHDLGFAAFVGVLPPPPDGSEFCATWDYENKDPEVKPGWYKGDGYEKMHLQGRKWGGDFNKFNSEKGSAFKGSIFSARPTFESYGLPHGSPDLSKALPDDHKKFLADMVWIHEETNEGTKTCKLIAVHGGLKKDEDVEEQMKYLRSRDTSIPEVEAISGRGSILRDIPEELAETQTILVSGHHGKLSIKGLRLIIDECDGLERNPMAAIVLPYMKIVRDTDTLKE